MITITFLPAGDPQAVLNVTSGVTRPAADCAAGSGPCLTLHFTMPSTVSATYPDGLAGPAEIRVTNGATAAVIGPLSQPRPDTTCDKMAETVFKQFTVLPPPNVFRTLVDNPATRVLAALDGSGSLLIPFDYRAVLPLGPAEPVAALLSGSTSIDAFQSAPGTPIDVPDSSWVRSFTIDGRPVPPLLRATDAGNQVFGASDGAEGIVRLARTLGGAPPIFDLQYLRSSNGRGPVVIPGGRYSLPPPGPAVPLANLRSTAVAAAFTRDESLEGNLNGAPFSSDTDENDDVVEIIDVATFTSTLTGMAASPTNNPIVGGAVVETGGDLVALLESEAGQGGADLNGNGQPGSDDVLRVLTTTGTQLTPTAPGAALLGSPFPGVDRRSLAIDGSLVYFREPNVGFQTRSGFIEQGLDVAVSRDGRFIFTTNPSSTGGCGEIRARRRDGATGGLLSSPPGTRGQCSITKGANGVVVSPSGNIVYVAAPTVSTVSAFRLSIAPDQISIGGSPGSNETSFLHNATANDGLLGVTRLAITPGTSDGSIFGPRVSLYALAPANNAITAFNVSENFILVQPPVLGFVKTLLGGTCTPDATHGCLANFSDPRNLVVSPDGKHVYVAVHGTSRIKGFVRTTNSAAISEIGEWVDGSSGGSLLGGAIDVAISPDGNFVYALADTDAAITIFSRNATSGLLTLVGTVSNGGSVTGLSQGRRILVSPDGHALVVSNASSQVVVFDRNTATGALIINQQAGSGPTGLATANLAISPDSEHVYLEKNNQDSGDVFTRPSRLRAFDASTGQTRPGLDSLNTRTNMVSVAAGRAAYLEPVNLFGSEFTLVGLYDAATDTSQSLDSLTAIADRLALSSQILAVAAPESRVGDADGDGNTSEDTLLVVPTANPNAAPTIVGVDALDLGATDICEGGTNAGDACVTSADCAGGSCVGVAVALKVRASNFDGGQDLALSVYRFGDPVALEIGKNVVDFEVSGNLIAFRDSENGLFRLNCNDHNEISFDNDDGDCTDLVMRIFDLKTWQLIDTRQATIKCEQPGCEPGRPYKILGDSVAFLTREADQGNQDLDGNGVATDTVVQVYNVRSAQTKINKIRPGATILPPLPTTFLGAPIVYREVLESDIGRDVNEDGDQSDIVVLVDGDSDGDGVFDSTDDCVETPDPQQLDSDGDGLGDACDPTPFCGAIAPAAPPVPRGRRERLPGRARQGRADDRQELHQGARSLPRPGRERQAERRRDDALPRLARHRRAAERRQHQPEDHARGRAAAEHDREEVHPGAARVARRLREHGERGRRVLDEPGGDGGDRDHQPGVRRRRRDRRRQPAALPEGDRQADDDLLDERRHGAAQLHRRGQRRPHRRQRAAALPRRRVADRCHRADLRADQRQARARRREAHAGARRLVSWGRAGAARCVR